MNFPTGLGGITLIVIAIIWLLIFVPGWTKRSEVKEVTTSVARVVRAEKKARRVASEDRVARLFRTQRLFALLSVVFLISSASVWFITATSPVVIGLSALFTVLAIASFGIRRVAKKQLSGLVRQLNAKRQVARERVIKEVINQNELVREWTPNQLPAPLNFDRPGELLTPDADVIPIKNSEKKNFDTQDLNAILRRRRAI